MEIAYYKGGGDGETAAAYCVQTYYFCKSYLHICIQSHLKREDFDFLISNLCKRSIWVQVSVVPLSKSPVPVSVFDCVLSEFLILIFD